MKTLKTLILAIVCLFATAAMAQQPQSKGQMNAQKLATTLYLIENFYVDTANIDKVTDAALPRQFLQAQKLNHHQVERGQYF